jgi:hypothetical protein
VVEKALDVKKEKGGGEATRHSSAGRVDHRMNCINGTMIVPGPELGRGKDVVGVGVLQDASRDDPFQELAAALQQRNGPVGLQSSVVCFIWLREGDHRGMTPRVYRKGEAALKHVDEALWSHHERPLDEFVIKAARSGCGGVRGFGQGSADLISRDRGEAASGERQRVIT